MHYITYNIERRSSWMYGKRDICDSGEMKYYNFPRRDSNIYPHIVVYIVHRKHNSTFRGYFFFLIESKPCV